MKTPLLLVKTLLSLMLFSIITTSSIAQNWQQVYFEDFNAHSRIPREFIVQNFSSSLIGYGASGANDDKCASSTFLTYGTYIAHKVLLEDGVTYRFGWNLKTKEPGRKIQYMYGSALSLASATHSGSSLGIPVLDLTGPGEDIYSEEIEGTGDVVFLIAAVPSAGNVGSINYNVHFDNFTIEKLNVSYLNFDVASIEIEEGGSAEVCISLSDHASNAFDVELAFEGGQSPHFTSTQPISLSFNEGDTQQCFTLQTEPDNGVEDDILNYVLNILPPDAGTGVELGDVTTLQIQVLEGDGCPYAGMDQITCEGVCVTIGCPEEEGTSYCYLWYPQEGIEEGGEYLSQTEVCPTETTTYTIFVTDDQGNLIDEDEVVVTIENDISVMLEEVYTVCPGESIVLEPEVTGTGNFEYMWSTGDNTETLEVTPERTTDYTLEIQNTDDGCMAYTETRVVVFQEPEMEIYASSSTVCEMALIGRTPNDKNLTNEDCTNESVSLYAGHGLAGYTYQWSTGESSWMIEVLEAGEYDVTITRESDGCSTVSTYTIESCADVEISPVDIVNQGAGLDAGAGFTTYQWSTGQADQMIPIDGAGTYSVTVTDENGCMGSDEVEEQSEVEPKFLLYLFTESS